MITKFKLFEDFQENDEGDIIVVAKDNDDYAGIIKGHRYIVREFDRNGKIRVVWDIVNNNRKYFINHDNFVSEDKYGIEKYNL
jgi:hypothetical protein